MEKLELGRRLAIFDLDGTLIDSRAQITKAVELARLELKMPKPDLTLLESKIGLPANELFADLNLDSSQMKIAIDCFRRYLFKLELSPQDLFPKTKLVLETLKSRGYYISLGTNKPSNLAKRALAETQIIHFFDHLVGGETLPAKPHPSILVESLKFFELSTRVSVMIGDRKEDMQAAREINMPAVAVKQGIHDSNSLTAAGASKVFSDMTNFFTHLNQGWNFEDL